MERTRGDKEDMIGAHHAIARVDRGSFNDGQYVALYAFAGDIGSVAALAAGDLVYLVEKHNAAGFDPFDSDAIYLVHVDQAALFFLHQVVEGVRHLHFSLLRAAAEDVGKHVLEVHLHVFKVLVADDAELRGVALAHVQLHLALVQFALTELLAHLFSRALVALDAGQSKLALGRWGRGRWRRQQDVEQSFFGVHLGLVFHLFQSLFAHHVDGNFDQIPNNGLHVAPDIADLGELRGFHFEEWGIGQFCQPARNLRLAY